MVHEEVVIDGDSTEGEEEEVCIVTPQSRKRRRRSNILLDHDDEDEEEGEVQEEKEDSVVAPRRQQQLTIGSDGVSSQPMTLRTPTPTRRSRRNLQQLSISAAVARGDRERRGEQHEDAEDAEEDGDDEVVIIQPPSGSSVTSSGRKRRPAIQDSDEELELSQKEQEVHVAPSKSEEGEEASSASRRSSRIQHKRKEKEKQHGSVRKLDYPVLGNCLETLQIFGPHFKGNDGEDDKDEDYEEEESEEEAPPPPKKKRKSLPREGDRDRREKVYADGGEDMDDFICEDDEVEFMDDDEQGVISVGSSDDEMGGDDPSELAAMMEVGRSREMVEWFSIYMEYLEACIIDSDLEAKMYRKRFKPKYQLYKKAADSVERRIGSCRDTVRSAVMWPDEMVDALNCASQYRSDRVSAEQDCEACNRRQHVATYHVDLAGAACDATKLYGNNWMRHLKEAAQEADPVQASYEMGSTCHARTLAYWQMLHAKQFWCILVDAKLKKCADSTGRIAPQYRDEFFKQEFGRYKKLVGLVEKFADDSKRIAVYMPNLWKSISRRTVTSDLLPLLSRVSSFSTPESRRGTLDAFVADSEEEEETEDEEAVMEKMEEGKRVAANGNKDEDQATDDEEQVKPMETSSPHQTPRSESKKEQQLQHEIEIEEEDEKKEKPQAKEDKSVTKESVGERDIDDLKCLVCDASPRNAGVVHGLYLHVYCCYACGKRQQRYKSGCMVCNRPIDRVLRLLPLTLVARNAIRNQSKS